MVHMLIVIEIRSDMVKLSNNYLHVISKWVVEGLHITGKVLPMEFVQVRETYVNILKRILCRFVKQT